MSLELNEERSYTKLEFSDGLMLSFGSLYMIIPFLTWCSSSQRVGCSERGAPRPHGGTSDLPFGEHQGRVVQDRIGNAFDHAADSLIIYVWPY